LPEVVQLPGKIVASDLSSPSVFSHKPVVQALQDAMGKTHYLVKYDVTRDLSGCCRTKNRSARSVWRETKEEMLASILSLVGTTSVSATMLAAGIVSTTMCKK
jgi:hypothetical protein